MGIAVDTDHGQVYWTQKGPDNAGQGRIFRANLESDPAEAARTVACGDRKAYPGEKCSVQV